MERVGIVRDGARPARARRRPRHAWPRASWSGRSCGQRAAPPPSSEERERARPWLPPPSPRLLPERPPSERPLERAAPAEPEERPPPDEPTDERDPPLPVAGAE
jgi:hypothetical protein